MHVLILHISKWATNITLLLHFLLNTMFLYLSWLLYEYIKIQVYILYVYLFLIHVQSSTVHALHIFYIIPLEMGI